MQNIQRWRTPAEKSQTKFNNQQMSSDIKQKYDLKNIGIAIGSIYEEIVDIQKPRSI